MAEEITRGSRNVFRDLGSKDPDTALLKARLAFAIQTIIEGRKLTQREAADRMGLDQPKVSEIIRGKLRGYTIDRLIRCITALGEPVEVTLPGINQTTTVPAEPEPA